MEANNPPQRTKVPEHVLMSPDTVMFFRESLAEIKSDLKDIKSLQHRHDKQIDLIKYKMLVLAGVGGGGAHYVFKFLGL